MTNERKQLLKEKIKIAFDSIHALSLEMNQEDFMWADKLLDSGNFNEADEYLAMSIINLSDDMRELSCEFMFTKD